MYIKKRKPVTVPKAFLNAFSYDVSLAILSNKNVQDDTERSHMIYYDNNYEISIRHTWHFLDRSVSFTC